MWVKTNGGIVVNLDYYDRLVVKAEQGGAIWIVCAISHNPDFQMQEQDISEHGTEKAARAALNKLAKKIGA